ncbi:uncharacterized protein PG986_014696 [Apiospora aurea]|uniref:Uncharacterized protein n=1 Tax=Apiospora aurea TaxID=335848 RepID=A0ABR1PTT2_9PEZI
MQNLDKFYSWDPEAHPDDDWVNDGRSHHPAVAAAFGSGRAKELARALERGGPAARDSLVQGHVGRLLQLERPGADRIRAHIASTVRDPATAARLTPWYPMWCKRPAYHAGYLASFKRPNVTLVDADGQGVQSYTRQGRGGARVPIRRPRARHGVMANVGISGNSTPAYTHGGRLVAHVLKTATADARAKAETGAATGEGDAGRVADRLVVEATKEAEDRWTGAVEKGADWFAGVGICTPTWYTGYQRLADKMPAEQLSFRKHGLWPAGPLDYADIINDYIQKGSLEGFTVRSWLSLGNAMGIYPTALTRDVW